jgi:hypothetical protein
LPPERKRGFAPLRAFDFRVLGDLVVFELARGAGLFAGLADFLATSVIKNPVN